MTLNTSSLGRGRRETGGKGSENKNNKWHIQNRQGDVKNSIGNGEAKELVCTPHGHELRVVGMLVGGGCWEEWNKEGKKWDNCNSIINKIHLKI